MRPVVVAGAAGFLIVVIPLLIDGFWEPHSPVGALLGIVVFAGAPAYVLVAILAPGDTLPILVLGSLAALLNALLYCLAALWVRRPNGRSRHVTLAWALWILFLILHG